eukprot:CAMPEP_0113474778 /NCGR_PEP_ID=MMETSP0014_2-20120614/18770_1 /TAXON_ID=2857 /ORGANISM="Nitzschia sp." /LENGTH=48 /DNA_ID=CAMNT_0000367657 /DNA_START=333 /DNA_END=475 /DNA_ORIENTATION=- /assembly_acc=CAM_ASM_000159
MPSGGYKDKQQREINAFAAMANGDYEFGSSMNNDDDNNNNNNAAASTT